MKRLLLITITCIACLTRPHPCPAEFFFHDGDTPIVFLGDSITEQHLYTTLVEAYVLTRYPGWNVTFRNIGWGGDTSGLATRGGIDKGMQRDILPLKPRAITIDFGMNDARAGEAGYPKFIENSTQLAQQLKAAGARVALVTPSPEERYEPNQPGGSAYNLMLWKYSLALKDISAKEGVAFVDQYTPFIHVIEEGRKAGVLGANAAPRLIPDGVHPVLAGHLVMAASILKGLGADALVSRAEIDATARKVTATERCKVELLDDTKAALAFRRTDDSLPWPIPPETQFLLKVPGFTLLEDLDRYELKVTNLTAANYVLTIDDQKIDTFSKENLAAGVNLALKAGPITEQAMKVFSAVQAKNSMFFGRWRSVQLFALPAWMIGPESEALRQKEIARLDASIIEQEKQINSLRQPLPHVFKLTPAE